MCGICGIAALESGAQVDPTVIAQMSASLAHRGPDDAGAQVEGSVGLGFRRLSIIDLSAAGHQPMSNEQRTLWIVFNGEVYNFKELRVLLQARGYSFASATDTEVVLHLYEEFGAACLSKLEGMFAFAIWDKAREQMFLARDRVGVKPLYYAHAHGSLTFASESKAILLDPAVAHDVSQRGLANFFTYGHSVAPHTIYSGIRKLSPGHALTYNSKGLKLNQWWRAPCYSAERDEGGAYYAGRTRHVLRDSVRDCLVSDAPLGVFLSGGLDSSAIVGIMARDLGVPVATFSLGFDAGPEFNELHDARIVAKHFGTQHHELVATSDDLIKTLERLAWHFDDPFGDPAALPVYMLAEFARRHVKVVLTGEGGDELFGGYRRASAERLAPWFHRLPKPLRSSLLAAAGRGLRKRPRLRALTEVLAVEEAPARMAAWHTVFREGPLRALVREEWIDGVEKQLLEEPYREIFDSSMSPLANKLYSDLVRYLPDTFLEKTDKATMAASLEARVPFLERRMVEFAATIPTHYKVRGARSKPVLRAAVADLLPPAILKKRKQGFAVPVVPWFRLLASYAEDILLGQHSGVTHYLRRDRVEALLRDYRQGVEANGEYLWLLLSFELWHRAFMNGKGARV